ncbi:MAG: hypothetical protein PHW56_06735 [Methanosarcinaceae archaeon]|nr:hypothetical protein [Methanosarcinaceae archaeon]
MSQKSRKPAKTFYRSEDAIATAVAAALLLGIIIAFITNIQVNYVPEWKEDAEYEHMSEVWEDMARLKSNADILSAGLVISPDYRISLSSPIRMGGGDLPVVGRMKSGGTLTINTQGNWMEVNITTDNSSSNPVPNPNKFKCGSITYHSSNIEYIDQTYCYENGALIVSQNDRSLMKLSPSISLEAPNSSYINFTVTAISLEGNSGVLSSNSVEEIKFTSESLEPIYTTDPSIKVNSVSMTIFTEKPEAWATYLNNSIENANLYSGDYTMSKNESDVLLELHPIGKTLNVNIHKAELKTETGIQ